jgi:hypothetical protein
MLFKSKVQVITSEAFSDDMLDDYEILARTERRGEEVEVLAVDAEGLYTVKTQWGYLIKGLHGVHLVETDPSLL